MQLQPLILITVIVVNLPHLFVAGKNYFQKLRDPEIIYQEELGDIVDRINLDVTGDDEHHDIDEATEFDAFRFKPGSELTEHQVTTRGPNTNPEENGEQTEEAVIEYTNAYPSNKKFGIGAWATDDDGPYTWIYRFRRRWIYMYKMVGLTLKQNGEPEFHLLAPEFFPAQITSVLTMKKRKYYYFFERQKYCKRPFTLLSRKFGTCPGGWLPNKELFGCLKQVKNPELQSLCRDPVIDGSINIRGKVYLFRKNRYWVFDGRGQSTPLGNLVKGNKKCNETWPGFKPQHDGVFQFDDKLMQVAKNQWTSWSLKNFSNAVGPNPIKEQLVTRREVPKFDDVWHDRWQAFVEVGKDRAAALVGEKNFYLAILPEYRFVRKETIHHNLSKERFPPNVTGALDFRSKSHIHFFRDDMYCYRPVNGSKDSNLKAPEFCEWKRLYDYLKCEEESKKNNKMFELCVDLNIKGAAYYKQKIWLFQESQYWTFDNKPTSTTGPFGKLVEGAVFAADTFTSYDQNNDGIFAPNDNKIIMMRRKPPDEKPNTGPKSKPKTTTPRLKIPEHNYCYIIAFNETTKTEGRKEVIAQVIDNKVYFYHFDHNRQMLVFDLGPKWAMRKRQKFPRYAQTAFQHPIHKQVYYFFREDEFCKRTLRITRQKNTDYFLEKNWKYVWRGQRLNATDHFSNTYSTIDTNSLCIWLDNKQLFGCNKPRRSRKLMNLCNFPVIDGALIIGDNVLIYSRGSIYNFNGIGYAGSALGSFQEKAGVDIYQGLDFEDGCVFSYRENILKITDTTHFTLWSGQTHEKLVDLRPIENRKPNKKKGSQSTTEANEETTTSVSGDENGLEALDQPSQTTKKPKKKKKQKLKVVTSTPSNGESNTEQEETTTSATTGKSVKSTKAAGRRRRKRAITLGKGSGKKNSLHKSIKKLSHSLDHTIQDDVTKNLKKTRNKKTEKRKHNKHGKEQSKFYSKHKNKKKPIVTTPASSEDSEYDMENTLCCLHEVWGGINKTLDRSKVSKREAGNNGSDVNLSLSLFQEAVPHLNGIANSGTKKVEENAKKISDDESDDPKAGLTRTDSKPTGLLSGALGKQLSPLTSLIEDTFIYDGDEESDIPEDEDEEGDGILKIEDLGLTLETTPPLFYEIEELEMLGLGHLLPLLTNAKTEPLVSLDHPSDLVLEKDEDSSDLLLMAGSPFSDDDTTTTSTTTTEQPKYKKNVIIETKPDVFIRIQNNRTRKFRRTKRGWDFNEKDKDLATVQPTDLAPEYPPTGLTARLNNGNYIMYFRENNYCKVKMLKLGWKCQFLMTNKDLFKCDENIINETAEVGYLEPLCKNPLITGGFVAEDRIYLFRYSTYWTFSVDAKNVIGELLSGPLDARRTWDGWQSLNDGFFFYSSASTHTNISRFVMFKKNRWWAWLPNGTPEVIDSSINGGVMGVGWSWDWEQQRYLIRLHSTIKGQWFNYLKSRWLLSRLKTNSRILPIHDIHGDGGPQNLGVLPYQKEWRLESPSQSDFEDIFIYGLTSAGQQFKLSIKWRPQENNSVFGAVDLFFTDADGNRYVVKEEETIKLENRHLREYKIGGVAFEVLSPMRRYRVKVRGMVEVNGQPTFVRMRLHWLTLSNTFQMTYDFDNHFMAIELLNSRVENAPFENRWEQFGQLKGTIQVEDEKQKELFYWGGKSKKILEKQYKDMRIYKVIGYTSKGQGLHLGVVDSKSAKYRYGYCKLFSAALRPLTDISISAERLEEFIKYTDNSINHRSIQFSADFENYHFDVEIRCQIGGLHEMIINGHSGKCFIVREETIEWQGKVIKPTRVMPKCNSLVLSLDDQQADDVSMSGGKGASLAHLIQLSKLNQKNPFEVPRGLVITTNAYKLLIERNLKLAGEIEKLQKLAWKEDRTDLKSRCQEVVDLISGEEISEEIVQDIEEQLYKIFGKQLENVLFAVRSSASGEDSEEMSAAGQMTSYLGVKGLKEIAKSVMKCWASQFAFVPVEYKRGYGQLIQTPMAVVIQEMVDCDSAGVIFTCDPVTGDERLLTVTANYGLGETVVSASAEPDTIKLKVRLTKNVLSEARSILGIHSKEIGSKKSVLRLSKVGGTTEQSADDPSKCCLSDEQLIKLGEIALDIHRHYGNARDIEWGIKDSDVFILQSRPITNLDNSFTEYEIIHEIDSGHQSEHEIMTRLHVAETFPKSSSYASKSWYAQSAQALQLRNRLNLLNLPGKDYCPFIGSFFSVAYNQVFFNLRSGSFDIFRDFPEDERGHEFVRGFLGFIPDDPDVMSMVAEKKQYQTKPTGWTLVKIICWFGYSVIFAGIDLKKFRTKFIKEHELVRTVKSFGNSKQMFDYMFKDMANIEPMKHHMSCSMASTVRAQILKGVLRKIQKENQHVENDFNLLISSCNEVVSCEGPNKMRRIALAIENKDEFKELSDEEALNQLKHGQSEASKLFQDLLEKNGHRGYAEGDPWMSPWKDNPMPIVKSVKMMLRGGVEMLKEKKKKSVDQILAELKTPLSGKVHWMVKNIWLPMARNAIGYREQSRDLMIWDVDQARQSSWHMARKMVEEGLIPEAELVFFLTAEELESVVNQDRNPMIIMKARLRRQSYKKTDNYKFEDFCKGPDFKPINMEEREVPTNDGCATISGTTVCNGYVKGRVCVAEDLSEADKIQPGDILITYATDIGWSPYLPLISGLITEIGGTISHGAVVAREYGIPCLIAAKGACKTFQTGDVCVLDTETATVFKV